MYYELAPLLIRLNEIEIKTVIKTVAFPSKKMHLKVKILAT